MVNNALRSALDEPCAPFPPARVRRDWLLVAGVVIAASLEVLLRDDLELPWLCWLVAVGLSPTLLWRRTHPLAAVAVAFGTATVIDIGLIVTDSPALDMFSVIYFLLLPYSLFRWASGRQALAGLAIILTAATTGFFVSWTGVADLIGGSAVLLSAFAVGLAVRSQHGARERRLEQAKSAERVMLARELHDTVAHHVSAIAIHAQAGRALAATSPTSPVEALEVIEAEASRTLAEMRAMVRVLRNQEPAEYAPQPGVADLDRLADTGRVGPRVAVELTGDLTNLPSPVDAALYRMAQESVTNALRHAQAATRVDVRVTGDSASVNLWVRDDGLGTPGRDAPSGGFGLVGLAERAALLGGTFHAGPSDGRGWAVDVTLPRVVPA